MSIAFKLKLASTLLLVIPLLGLSYYWVNMDKTSGLSKPSSGKNSFWQDKKTMYYKWQDESGQWHMSDTAPAGIAAQRVNVNTDENVIQSIAVEKPKAVAAPHSKQQKQQQPPEITSPIITPAQAKKALQEAEQVKELMQHRQQQLDALL